MTKVLMFETDDDFAGEVWTLLARQGCTLQVLRDGGGALIAAQNSRPDVILVCAELPEVNGFSVSTRPPREATARAIPLLILSAQSSPEAFAQHARLPTRADDY